ncbi:MAG: diguanylate cyclase [Leptothrix ochracea]|uniref:diguanylate cyclase domain-containing protein n=1 Tax=Leptothrix ochracea TaxID=735331 RepID=UPI0034E29CDD
MAKHLPADPLLLIALQEENTRLKAALVQAQNALSDQAQTLVNLRRREHDLQALLDQLPSTIGYWDRSLRNRFCNAAYRTWWDVNPSALEGVHIREVLGEVMYERNMPHLESALAGEPQIFERVIPAASTRESRHVLVHYTPDVVDGEIQGLCVLVSDITTLKQADEQIRLSASVFETSLEAIMVTDAEHRIIDINPAFTAITGYERHDVLHRNPRCLGSNRQDRSTFEKMWAALNSVGAWRGEVWNQRKNGETYPALISIARVLNDRHQVLRYVGVFSDISRLKEHQSELERIAHFDPLTGIPNRRLLSRHLDQAVQQSRRSGRSLAICYLDLDGFKTVNDHMGHEKGDQLLVAVTTHLQQVLRHGDTVARLGGDEFVLLLNEMEQQHDYHEVIQRALSAVTRPVQLGQTEVSISASIGVTIFPQDDSDPDTLLRHADQAMYRAKESGKNRYQLFSDLSTTVYPARTTSANTSA